MVNKFKVFRKY